MTLPAIKEKKYKRHTFTPGKNYCIHSIRSSAMCYDNITYIEKKGPHHVFKMYCPNGDSWLFTQTDTQLMNKIVEEA